VLADPFIKQTLKRILRQIAKWKGFRIHAWYVGDEHIHLYVSIPPSYSPAYAIGILKGKSSTWLKKHTKKFPTGTLWARGYFISTVGVNEEAVRRYVQNQSHHKIELIQRKLEF
jgi:putative transposase